MRYAVAGALAALSLTASLARADVVVGLAGPVTGQYAAFFEQMKRGAELAVADLNAKGGITGEKVQLMMADDACDPRQAVAVANQIVGRRAVAVIGHFCSSSSIPASDVYSESGVPMITPASTNPRLTDRGLQDVFRMCGRDDQQAVVVAEQIIARKLGTKIAIVHDKSTYGAGIAEGVRANLNGKGVKEVLFDSVTQGDRDFSALISRMKSLGVDVVFFGGYHTEAGLIARQAREQGFNAKLVGGDGLATTDFAAIAGSAGDGFMFTFYPDPRENGPATDLVKRFRAQGYEPEGFTLYSYAAVTSYAEAASRAGSTDGRKVSAELHKGSYDTVLGKISFNTKGDPNSEPFVLYSWSGGTYAPMH